MKAYEDFDKSIRGKVESISYEDQRTRHRAQYGSELPDAELKRIESEDFALNWVAKTCLASFGDRQRLQDRINERLRAEGGFVVLGASFFKALVYGPDEGEYTVIGTGGRIYRVTDVSELLHHLQQARKHDVLLHVYALWPGETPGRWDEATRNNRREAVVRAMVKLRWSG